LAYEPLARLTVSRYALSPPGWPPGLKLRLVALADLHACEPWMSAARIASICSFANELGGDITLLLGDYVSGMNLVTRYVHSSEWSKALSTLKAPLGVHAIMGNHDWWEDRTAQTNGGGDTFAHRALADVGIPVYSNRAARLEKEGHGFWLAGLEDQLALLPGRKWGRSRMQGLDDLGGTLAQVSDDAPVILLAHEPDIFPRVPERVSLTLSGHTHGGQIRLFGYSPVVPSRYGDRYAYGHIVENGRNIIVSGGLGCSIAPIRFGVPPEILVIDLG
jgi:predicted MPP superfamily phosphohydrolase